MNLEKYTQKAQEAVMESQNIAISHGHQQLDGESTKIGRASCRERV